MTFSRQSTAPTLAGMIDLFHRFTDCFDRLCSNLIVVPPLAQGIQEDPDELEDLLQGVVIRIVGEISAELVVWMAEQIRHSPGIDYTWPGNVREAESAQTVLHPATELCHRS